MASEIRVNRLSNRSGLSTITFANGGVQFSGITTFANGEFYVGTGATIINPGTNEFNFHTGGSNRFTINNSGANLGTGNITAVDATFTGNVSIGKTLTYEDVKNVDSVGVVTARTGVKVTGGDLTVGTAITASSVTGNVTQDVGITTFSGTSTWFKGQTANKDMYWSKSSGSLIFKDTAAALFGDSSDLQISHDGSNSTILNTTGELIVRDDSRVRIRTDQLVINSGDNSESIIYAEKNGAVQLYFNGAKTVETTVNALHLTGNASESNIKLMTSDGTQRAFIGATNGNAVTFYNGTSEKIWDYTNNGPINLYYDNAKKLETTSLGARVVGDLQMGNTVGVRFHHTGTTSIFETQTAGDDLLFKTTPSGGSTTERLRIHANGKISIGVDNDSYELTLQGVSGGAPTLWLRDGTTSASPRIIFGDTGNALQGSIYYHNNGDYMSFSTNGSTERLRITSGGQVNIGGNYTQTSNTLNVTGNIKSTTRFNVNDAVYLWQQNRMSLGNSFILESQQNTPFAICTQGVAQPIVFGTSTAGGGAVEHMRIHSDGDVTIGNDPSGANSWWGDLVVANTNGAAITVGDTGSGEKFTFAANGDCNIYSYKNDDSICFNTTTGGTTTQILKLLGDGNIRWYPDGSSGVNLLLDHGSSSVIIGAYKNGSTGTSFGFKNQTSAGSAATWMEVNDSQCVSMPYGMGGTQILNLYNTTGRKGLNIFANVSGGNQNSDAGVIDFNGYAQTNGAWIQATNEEAYGKKDLLLGTSWGTPNDYSTRNWDKPVVRLTWQGFVGMHEAATTNAAVTSLLHIKGNSDNGADWATLTIEDSDDTAGSKEPTLAFDGNGTRQGRIMSSDTTGLTNTHAESGGLYFGVGSSNTTALQITNNRGIKIYKDARDWATVRHNNSQGLRTHVRQYYSPGNAVQTQTIMRIRRHWWGWGTYKIRCKALYYNSSLESTYFVNGHGSGGNSYTIAKETFGGNASNQDWSCTVTHTASNNSPGTSSTWYADIKVNIPNYYYVIIYVEAYSSQYSMDPSNMGTDSYCMM